MLDFAELEDTKKIHEHKCFTCQREYECSSGCKGIRHMECDECVHEKISNMDLMNQIINAG
jgi:hypothetical protein